MSNLLLWQNQDWEKFQNDLNHRSLRMSGFSNNPLLIIFKRFLGKNTAYIPRGPILSPNEIKDFFIQLKKLSKKHNLIFTRIDPEHELKIPKIIPFKKSHSVQPETTLILDLTLSEKDLLQQMKRKGRYNIGLAQKKGIIIKKARTDTEKNDFIKIFYKILQETTQRDEFSAHNEDYYHKFLRNISGSEIFLAYYEDQPVAGGIFVYLKDVCIYYFGASSNTHRELMTPYLLQWIAILEAKKRGCKVYDFLGIAPENAGKNHPWTGITDFKKKFGGVEIRYPRAVDIIHMPYWYKIYKLLKILQRLIKK